VIAGVSLTITGNLGGGVVGSPYTATLGATGGYGAGTYTFSVASGVPPPGLTFSASGAVSGAPTAAGTFNFTVQVTSTNPSLGGNSPPVTATQAYTVVIYPVLAIATQTASSGTVGAPYSQTFTATGGAGPSSYTWSVANGTLPPGLTLSAQGVLFGTPTASGSFSLTVQVTSQAPTVGAQTTSQAFSIVIAGVSLAITGNLSGGVVGSPYSATLGATGAYGAGTYTFSVTTGALPSGLTLSAGGALSGTPSAAGTFNFTVQVTSTNPSLGGNSPPLTATQSVTVVVYPVLAITTQSANSGTVGVSYSQTFTATGGGGASTYTWSVASGTLPPGLTLSAAGVLSGTPATLGTFSLSVQVSSQVPTFATQTASQAFSVVIAAAPPLAVTGSLSGGVVGALYTATLGASGGYGAGTYTFSLTTGALPSGLTLSAGGTLSGTPTAAATSTFTVQVTSTLTSAVANVPQLTATQSFTVVIYPSLVITPPATSSGTVGVPYSQTFTATGGAGASTYTWAAGNSLPPGLTLSAAGVLSGVPTAAGSFTFNVSVTSQVPSVGSLLVGQAFTVVIAAVPPPSITGNLGDGSVGGAYAVTLGVTGGYGTGAFSLPSGALPPGITLSAGGTVSGTPTAAGTYTFTLQVTSTLTVNGVSLPTLTGTQAFTVTVYPPLVITPPVGSLGTMGVAFSQTFTASGGAGASTYTWSVASGTPPPGLTLSAAGAVSGTPTAAGNFTFTVQVSSQIPNGGAQTASQAFSITITPPLTITGNLGSGTVGVPYSATLSGSGGYGTGTYTFTAVSGTLPLDITLTAGGILSGTPTAAGTSTFTVQVTSTQASPPLTATQSFTITIGLPPVPPVTISGLPNSPAPATQLVVGVSAGSAYPIDMQGTVTLTFAPDSGPDDPSVQFTTGGRATTFQIPAGTTQAQFGGTAPSVQTGTVAGTITLTLTLTAAGTDITPTPAPTQVLQVAKSVPVITSATVAPNSGGFSLVVVGYSTTRDMVSAAITFTPAQGVTLANNSANVSLSQIFTTWYQDSASAQFGSMFSLEIPFTFQNGTVTLTSVSVAITNSLGSSATATAAY
jgi:hypothetical protein